MAFKEITYFKEPSTEKEIYEKMKKYFKNTANVGLIHGKLKSEEKEQIIEKKPVIVEEPVDKLKTIGELIEEDDLELNIPDIEDTNEIDIDKFDTRDELDSINADEFEDNNIEEPTNTIDDILEDSENLEETKELDEIDEDEEDLFSLIDSMYEEKGE